MSTQVILLERIEKLGQMGDVVSVKPGYARNFLLPQRKALRASKDNVAYFEAQRKHLEAENDKKKAEAQKLADKLEGLKVPLIRSASEAGQLYGSVTARDIADEVSTKSGVTVTRGQIDLNQNFKMIGLFDVNVILHPELKVAVTVNIARTIDEAEIQEKSGQAVLGGESEEIAADAAETTDTDAAAEDQLKDVLEEGALEAEKERQAEAEAKAIEDAAKAEEKAAAKAEKDAAKAAKAAAEAPEEDAAPVEMGATEAPAEEASEEKDA